MNERQVTHHSYARAAGWVGFLLVLAYALTGSLQVLIWNPLAAAPGSTLTEILESTPSLEGSSTIPMVLVWASLGIVFATLGLHLSLRWKISTLLVIRCFLWLLVLGAPGLMFVSFPTGLGLADTYGISGADLAPWASLLYVSSAAALVILVLLAHRNHRGKLDADVATAGPPLSSGEDRG